MVGMPRAPARLCTAQTCFQEAFPKGSTSITFSPSLSLPVKLRVLYINRCNTWFQIPSMGVLNEMCSEFQQPLGALCCHVEGLVFAGCLYSSSRWVSQDGLGPSSSIMSTWKSMMLFALVHLLSQILRKR